MYFSDRANLLGALDLRNGRLIHSYPNMSCTAHHLLPLPTDSSSSSNLTIGLATIASDAGLRIHSTLPPKREGDKGNVGSGHKAKVEAMVGGVGIGSFLWKGHGVIEEKVVKKAVADGEEDEEDDEGSSGDEEEMWEGMSEVEDSGSESDEEPAPKKKSKK